MKFKIGNASLPPKALGKHEATILKLERPQGEQRKLVDIELAKKLCGLYSTGEEIARFLGVDYNTLMNRIKEHGYTNFPKFYIKSLGATRIKVRQYQWELAMAGNASMLIWLGKQYLGQREPSKFEEVAVINEAAKEAQAKFINDNSRVLKQLTQQLAKEKSIAKTKDNKKLTDKTLSKNVNSIKNKLLSDLNVDYDALRKPKSSLLNELSLLHAEMPLNESFSELNALYNA